jgi:uncharacterized protein YbaA (DUF1428 family)
MPKYVDGFVLPLAKKNVKAYRKLALICSKVWRDHGALDYRECLVEDTRSPIGIPFPKGMRAKKGETVVMACITFKSRAHRDKVNASVIKDKRLDVMMSGQKMPFDCRRMFYGGFDVLVDA